MRYLIISLLVTSVAGLTSNQGTKLLKSGWETSSKVHQEFLHLSQDKALFIEQKSLDSVFMMGREGSNQCLSFLHIPKNAGSALEKMQKHFVKAVDPTARHWGMFDHSLKCNGWHGCNFTYELNGKKETAMCPKWHVPPHLDPLLAASYTKGGCETFCVVRSPSDKWFSELKFYYANDGATNEGLQANCSMPWYHEASEMAATRTRAKPYWDNCHFVPQSEYVYGKPDSTNFVGEKKVYCNHQLRMENLKEDFDALMVKFNIPMTLGKATDAQRAKKFNCELPEEDRDEEKVAHDFIMDYYKDDLKNFEYAK